MNLLRHFVLILFLFVFINCHSVCKFDKSEWLEQSDLRDYPNRACMIDDLIKTHKLNGLKFSELEELIGAPNTNITSEPNELLYPIEIEYGNDIDPISGRTLVIVINKDSTIIKHSIVSWIR